MTTGPTRREWEDLGRAIKKARQDAGYRVRWKFAAELDINDATVGLIENGHPKRGEGRPASEDMYERVTAKIGWAPGEWKRRIGLISNDDDESDGGFAISAERRESLLRALRNIRESVDEAVEILGG